MRRPALLALSVSLLACACGKDDGAPKESPPSTTRSAGGVLDEARRLLEQGQAEAALAALQSAPVSAESLYLQGASWAKKAETAPLPTPPPAPSPLPRGYVPQPAPDWKTEETQALLLLEQAVSADAGHPRARKALADLLAPHALRRLEATRGAAKARPRGKQGKAEPAAAPAPATAEGPDVSPERVIREYRAAIDADQTSKEPVEALIAFCERADREAEVEGAFEELLKRERESAAPFVRYGDYLRARGSFDLAISQYRQALIWKADDEATKAKIGEIYVTRAEESLSRQEWATASERLKDAQKWVKDKNSPVGLKMQAAQAQLRQIRR
jgi:tetratricopeptide (TPR) repeat protein